MSQSEVITRPHRVHIPATMRHLTGGESAVEVAGVNVRQVIRNLDAAYPGFAELLLKDDVPAPGVAVAVNGNVTGAILAKLEEGSDIYFVPALGGG